MRQSLRRRIGVGMAAFLATSCTAGPADCGALAKEVDDLLAKAEA
jgi:hypothetical protein